MADRDDEMSDEGMGTWAAPTSTPSPRGPSEEVDLIAGEAGFLLDDLWNKLDQLARIASRAAPVSSSPPTPAASEEFETLVDALRKKSYNIGLVAAVRVLRAEEWDEEAAARTALLRAFRDVTRERDEARGERAALGGLAKFRAARVEQLETALRSYGTHYHDCKIDGDKEEPCTCGLDSVLTPAGHAPLVANGGTDG